MADKEEFKNIYEVPQVEPIAEPEIEDEDPEEDPKEEPEEEIVLEEEIVPQGCCR